MSEKNEALPIDQHPGVQGLAQLGRNAIDRVIELEQARARDNVAFKQLLAQRDALLEALKSTGLFLHHCWCDVQMNDYSFEKLNQQMAVVDAAIKAVEEGK